MELVSPTDLWMLLVESREHPMHVGALQLFERPQDAGPEFVQEAFEAMLGCRSVRPLFRKHPAAISGGLGNFAWSYDDDIDLDYHLRRSVLPAPRRVRDLLELISRLHGTLLDRHRPLWEAHLVEGLSEGRFALYVKFHHSLLDGVSALRLSQRALSPDPTDRETRVPWALPPRVREQGSAHPSLFQTRYQTVRSIAALAPSSLSLARAALLEQQLTLPFRAPRTMLNVRVDAARRVAAQSWSLKRIERVKNAAGVTVNDLVLAMCAGALRAYLAENDGLPETPLVAMVPVNLRKEGGSGGGGNLVGSLLCNLATHLDDPAKRLEAINGSMRDNKKVLAQLPLVQQLALSWFLGGGLVLALLPGFVSWSPPPFNIIISTVPGMRQPMYWKGARLDGNYPLSVVLDGQALSITVTNTADSLDFGLVGCRRSVPHLQRLLGHLESALRDLECAVRV